MAANDKVQCVSHRVFLFLHVKAFAFLKRKTIQYVACKD